MLMRVEGLGRIRRRCSEADDPWCLIKVVALSLSFLATCCPPCCGAYADVALHSADARSCRRVWPATDQVRERVHALRGL